MTVYQVTGRRNYREHRPGETFEAVIEPHIEEIALRFGSIKILESSTPSIRPGSASVPEGWLKHKKEG